MRVGIAARLSRKVNAGDGTERGAQTGIESSDAALIDWARREGHEIAFIAADFKSGTSHPWNRKNLRPWVTEPSKIAQYDAIVAYRMDRLSRGDDRSTSMIETWAYENGKQLLTEDGLRFPCEGADGIRWDVTKRIAHEEWLKTSERYTRMYKHLRAGGFHVGRSPYGYQSVPDGKHKTLVPLPAEAEVIRDAITWYLEGASLDDVCDRLNNAGRLPRLMKNGWQAKWSASKLSVMLHNEIIAGRQRDGKGKTILKVKPIVPREVWQAAIARMTQRSKRGGISQTKKPALLTSIIVCATCDSNMYRTARWDGTYAYYCRTKGCKSYIKLDVADGIVNDAMSSDHERDVMEILVPGSGHDIEIAEVKRDMAEAVEAETFERLPALRAELDRLRALPASPPRVEQRESDQTVAEMWNVMPDDTARRAYLLGRGARALYVKETEGFSFIPFLGRAKNV